MHPTKATFPPHQKVWVPIMSRSTRDELEKLSIGYSATGRPTKIEKVGETKYTLYAQFEKPGW